MHLYEGILTATSGGREVLVAGTLVAAAGTAVGLRRLDYERIPARPSWARPSSWLR